MVWSSGLGPSSLGYIVERVGNHRIVRITLYSAYSTAAAVGGQKIDTLNSQA